MALEEKKSGDHQLQRASSSGDHKGQCWISWQCIVVETFHSVKTSVLSHYNGNTNDEKNVNVAVIVQLTVVESHISVDMKHDNFWFSLWFLWFDCDLKKKWNKVTCPDWPDSGSILPHKFLSFDCKMQCFQRKTCVFKHIPINWLQLIIIIFTIIQSADFCS